MMVRIAPIAPDQAKAYNNLVKRGLREHPSSFDTDLADIEKRTVRSVSRGLARFDRRNGALLGAFDDDNRLVGTGMLQRRNGVKQAHCGEVLFVYVPTEYQGKGIGKKLMMALLVSARRIEGLQQLYLTVNLNGSAARALYASFGFQSIGILPQAVCVDGQYFDQEHMWLPLF